jgi:DNA-binding NarL/FixJ family response regulator
LVLDIVLMAVHMPEMDGLSATSIIKKERPEIGVVIATMPGNHTYTHEALQIGAAGYVLKMRPRSNSSKPCGTPRVASDEPQQPQRAE